jgi:hypothetical protein
MGGAYKGAQMFMRVRFDHYKSLHGSNDGVGKVESLRERTCEIYCKEWNLTWMTAVAPPYSCPRRLPRGLDE